MTWDQRDSHRLREELSEMFRAIMKSDSEDAMFFRRSFVLSLIIVWTLPTSKLPMSSLLMNMGYVLFWGTITSILSFFMMWWLRDLFAPATAEGPPPANPVKPLYPKLRSWTQALVANACVCGFGFFAYLGLPYGVGALLALVRE